ncbi:MAG: hypothetical protein B0W54_23855 [Cellvibrio sp. 79]|nr:MAG: hypothetical protein B0W54_23855 [Cellvibrio sp. 79]
MPFTYKDLTYIRAALQAYEGQLMNVHESDCEDDEFSEIQDDIQYISRLLALTKNEIKELENQGPSLNPVK